MSTQKIFKKSTAHLNAFRSSLLLYLSNVQNSSELQFALGLTVDFYKLFYKKTYTFKETYDLIFYPLHFFCFIIFSSFLETVRNGTHVHMKFTVHNHLYYHSSKPFHQTFYYVCNIFSYNKTRQ